MIPVLRPDWPLPPTVGALVSTRAGGVSAAPFDSLNLSRSVGDEAAAVAENRRRWAAAIGLAPVWLHLVHGARVLRLQPGGPEHPDTQADAAWTSEPGVVCQVTAADCLPVFFALRDGAAVGVAHAGWRGLAAGVLQATAGAICAGMARQPAELQVWLGPCIGPSAFEVGVDVLQAFGIDAAGPADPHFTYHPRSDGAARWLADLPALASTCLRTAGVQRITSSGLCTASDASRFFSYRRDGRTGRLAAAIWRR